MGLALLLLFGNERNGRFARAFFLRTTQTEEIPCAGTATRLQQPPLPNAIRGRRKPRPVRDAPSSARSTRLTRKVAGGRRPKPSRPAPPSIPRPPPPKNTL